MRRSVCLVPPGEPPTVDTQVGDAGPGRLLLNVELRPSIASPRADATNLSLAAQCRIPRRYFGQTSYRRKQSSGGAARGYEVAIFVPIPLHQYPMRDPFQRVGDLDAARSAVECGRFGELVGDPARQLVGDEVDLAAPRLGEPQGVVGVKCIAGVDEAIKRRLEHFVGDP